jgi:hypothetical protein
LVCKVRTAALDHPADERQHESCKAANEEQVLEALT